MNVCVFCSSIDALDDAYVSFATELGQWIGSQGFGLVWGGCNVGLMNVLGETVQQAGGKTHAVVPRFMESKGLVFEQADRVELVDSMHERKEGMRRAAEAYVALPGGVGTWEEFFEVLALKKLQRLDAPLVLVNTRGYYDPLLEQMRRSLDDRFSPGDLRDHFTVATQLSEVTGALLGGTQTQAAGRQGVWQAEPRG